MPRPGFEPGSSAREADILDRARRPDGADGQRLPRGAAQNMAGAKIFLFMPKFNVFVMGGSKCIR